MWIVRSALAGLATCLAGEAAGAAEWSIEPMLQWRMDHDSNRRMAVSGEQPNQGTWLTLDSVLKRATETSGLTLHPQVELQRFSGDSALDATNGSMEIALQRKSELSSVAVTTSYQRASTLTTELADTGIIDAGSRRDTALATVVFGHDFSERRHLDIQGSYSDVRYPDGLRIGLVGYRYPSLSSTYTINLTERTAVSGVAFADSARAPAVQYQSRDTGARFAASHTFSARASLYGSIGASRTVVNSNSQTGYVWELRASRSSELTQWSASYVRNVQPSGSGVLVRRDDVGLSLYRSVAPTLYLTGSLHDVRNGNLTAGPFLDVPRYFAGDTGLEWRPSPEWTVDLTGGLTEERLPFSRGTARGWRTTLSTRWTPASWSASR